MKKLLMLIAAMIICDAYGENVYWVTSKSTDYSSSASSITSCTNGGNITTPANPKRGGGHRFIGWEQGTTEDLWWIKKNTGTYNTADQTFTITFPYGTVSGVSQCSSSSFSNTCQNTSCTSASSLSTYGTRKYCWCKLTSINITDTSFPLKSQMMSSASNAKWIPSEDLGTQDSCNNNCTYSCSFVVGEGNSSYQCRKHLLTGN